MMGMIFLATLLLLGCQLAPSKAFIPNKLYAIAAKVISLSLEDAITHEEMTRSALLQVAAEVLRDNPLPSDPRGSFQRLSSISNLDEEGIIRAYYGHYNPANIRILENAIAAVEEANSNTDFEDEKYLAAAHFDSEQFESGQDRLIHLRQSVISSTMIGDVTKAREDTGRFLHALQDFYSHTNWIENGNRSPNPVLGQPNQRIEHTVSSTRQTCTDCKPKGWIVKYYECNDNIDESLRVEGLLTSGYAEDQHDSDGTVIVKPNGKCSHGGFIDSTRDTPALGGINKDGPYFKTSPHHYLHEEAAAVAQQATIDMLRDVRSAVNNDHLFGAYVGVLLGQAAIEGMKNSRINPLPMRGRARRQLPERLLLQYAEQVKGKHT